MSYHVLQPPKDESLFTELGKEIYLAAKGFGLELDIEGFLLAWVNGTRVVVERSGKENTITGLILVTVGKRWVHNDFTATVLFHHGDQALLEFTKQICSALGATALYVDTGEIEASESFTKYEITKFHLQ